MTQAFKTTPSVLALTRAILISDALMYSEVGGQLMPLHVVRHGIRGTQNVNKAGDREVSNIQQTDSAKLDAASSALVVKFDLRMTDIAETLEAMAVKRGDKYPLKDYRASYFDFVARAKESEGLVEVANRFARNVLNGRWLWRNRALASDIEIRVWLKGEEVPMMVVDALSIPMDHFDDYTGEERALGHVLAQGLRGESRGVTVKIEARVDFGLQGAIEVHPSQNYVQNKPKGLARLLYYVGQPIDERFAGQNLDDFNAIRRLGQAAIRDQKVGNALRTIDTWYADFEEEGVPIAVEPVGTSLKAQTFYREGDASAFALAKKFFLLDPNSQDGMFMIASLIRGGVYSSGDEKDKDGEKPAKPKKAAKEGEQSPEEGAPESGEAQQTAIEAEEA